MNAEVVLLSEAGVMITNARIVFPGETYALSNISSIKSAVDPKERQGFIAASIFVGLLGVFLLFGSQALTGLAFLALAIGLVVAAVQSKPWNIVFFATAGTERQAYKSKDAGHISRVIEAINRAIALRG